MVKECEYCDTVLEFKEELEYSLCEGCIRQEILEERDSERELEKIYKGIISS